tara:strand:- start:6256 stop:6627 length:372 start_codon:yes stop_codon:yes gene_type:complete
MVAELIKSVLSNFTLTFLVIGPSLFLWGAASGLVARHRGLSDKFCGLRGIASQDRSAALVHCGNGLPLSRFAVFPGFESRRFGDRWARFFRCDSVGRHPCCGYNLDRKRLAWRTQKEMLRFQV